MRRSRTSIFRPTVSSTPDSSGGVLRHQRLILVGGIALLVTLAWWFLLSGAGMAMPGMSAPPFAALLVMWWLMMAAMMLPSAAPAILLYARVRHMRGRTDAIPQSWVFLAGYLTLWLLFSLFAATAQQLLAGPAMALDNGVAESALLIAAGIYQLSPLKTACLGECRSPAQFISRHWRPGWTGTLRLGLLHGAYCVGCCWALMALLFVLGVMNVLWIALLAILVLAEKLIHGRLLPRVVGFLLLAAGLSMIV